MSQLSKNPANPQAAGYPVVSYRLQVLVGARRDAHRRQVSPDCSIAAVNATYRATNGNRFAARRAGWAAVDYATARGHGAGA